MRLQFPHFTRIFSATLIAHLERFTYLSLIIAIFSLNIFAHSNLQHPLTSDITTLLLTPYSATAHEDLAQVFWSQGYIDAGQKELLLAMTAASKNKTSVLGISSRLHSWEEEPERIQKEFTFWKQVAKEKPTYRDAYMQLSFLSYQLGYVKDAKEYLSRVQSLDPNSEYVEKMEKLLRENNR